MDAASGITRSKLPDPLSLIVSLCPLLQCSLSLTCGNCLVVAPTGAGLQNSAFWLAVIFWNVIMRQGGTLRQPITRPATSQLALVIWSRQVDDQGKTLGTCRRVEWRGRRDSEGGSPFLASRVWHWHAIVYSSENNGSPAVNTQTRDPWF